MSIDVQAHLGDMGDVAGVYWSAVDDLEMSGVLERVQWKVLLLSVVFVNECKPGSSAVDQ